MAQRKAESTGKAAGQSTENSIAVRTVIISSLLLAGIFIALFFLESKLAELLGRYADEAATGLMLLALWLVVGSGIRSIHSLSKKIPAWKLLLSGIVTAGVAAILYSAFLVVYPKAAKSPAPTGMAGASGGLVLLLVVLAFVISLIAIINLRVKNKALGNVLEFLIIGGCIGGFVYFATR